MMLPVIVCAVINCFPTFGQHSLLWGRLAIARQEIDVRIESSPSLRRHLEEVLQKTYRRAVKDALDETDLTALLWQR
jgi:hypothetical protein